MTAIQTAPEPITFTHDDGRAWFRIEYIDGMWEAIWPDEGGRRDFIESVPKVSMVYFIGGKTGPVKIGEAISPAQRLRSLQCGSPIPLAILATCSGGQLAERQYHRGFADARLHGEWFTRTREIQAEIRRLTQLEQAA